MKVLGIIAEYNPFHNGHLYQLQQAKNNANADYVVIIMSGDFVQRGTPAFMDKYSRAKMALLDGADLIIELPSLWATASAEYFAAAGIAALSKLSIVSSISFGVESDNLEQLEAVARILSEEPVEYRAVLSEHLKQGCSFPVARKQALLHYPDASAELEVLLATPNNILAIEYLKAMHQRNCSFDVHTILRKGSGYHNTDVNALASATAIRQAAFTNGNSAQVLREAMPEHAYEIFCEYRKQLPLLAEDDFSALLKYKLLSEYQDGFFQYADCSVDLSNRITKRLWDFTSYSGFCDMLKSKEVTHTRISRTLLHILLDMTNQDYMDGRAIDYIPYLRVLGFKKNAEPLLHAIKKQAAVPMITKPAAGENQLRTFYQQSYRVPGRMFELDLFASNLYRSLLCVQTNEVIRNEYNHGIVIV